MGSLVDLQNPNKTKVDDALGQVSMMKKFAKIL